MFLGQRGNVMNEPKSDDTDDIKVKFKPNAGQKTKAVASQLQEIFNGPLFAKMVRNAVEEMIIEGKLAYDADTDELDLPEDIVKRWSVRMEKDVWSMEKGSFPTK